MAAKCQPFCFLAEWGMHCAPTQKFPNQTSKFNHFAYRDRVDGNHHASDDNTAAMAPSRVTYRRRNP